jgi:hypothetical protein
MSNFVKNENDNWQKEVRSKLEDLESTLSLSNNKWNAWELEFIEDICGKLNQDIINVSPKQYEKVWDLWERI